MHEILTKAYLPITECNKDQSAIINFTQKIFMFNIIHVIIGLEMIKRITPSKVKSTLITE